MRIVTFLASVRSLTVAVPGNAGMPMRKIVALIALTACGQSFEVASVKLNTVAAANTLIRLPGGERLRAANFPLLWLIGEAYHVPNRQISGLPEAMSRDSYDIEAKAENPVSREQMMVMLQHLLEARFKLAVRRETKEMKAQVLVVAKGGAKLDENRDGADFFLDRIGRSKFSFHNVPMTIFANALSAWVDDTVVDQTGLKGTYDFELMVMLERSDNPQDSNAASVYSALQEQLGLKLESRKGPVEMLVIDHIEKLSGN
jgi:uncharacterized protein (TIGR03435 family)